MYPTASKPAPVLELSTTHKQIANWILLNPGATYRQMQTVFPYSIPWLCQVVKSDMFQAYIGERMRAVNAHVDQDVPAMLKGAAVLAVERVTEVLQNTNDPDLIVDAFDKVMHRYGYAPNSKASPAAQGPAIQQNNVFFLDRDELSQMRKRLLESHEAAPALEGEKVVNGLEPMPAT